ncbi:DNA-binding transcriptional repressor MngR [Vibrio thalassae]|uniref:DNA-binding transcriptional repressor MngR n=1 Tax=Vibrio thalassae TaxID=1243014 RepID=A0A240EI25_9VIBR|nr:GntR family transcriptional regulator [Vibrio thalassae]SNX48342.1 DNA-binding transcriptional repressor MngR [Vibrio thalassae]
MESKSLQPLYIQVADTLKQRIDEGLYPQGSKLPSESQLVESLGVSRGINELWNILGHWRKMTFIIRATI